MNKFKTFLKNNYYFFFIVIFIICITFPYINSKTNIIKKQKLYGDEKLSSKPIYTHKEYFKGNYQKQYENYYLENFPSRNIIIKIYNQLRYDFFNLGSVIIGKEDYLFEEKLESYYKKYLLFFK